MAITQNIRTGNGSTVLFNFTFEYLETTDVFVEVNDVLTTAYTFANATTIQFNTAPANGAKIRIYRKTDTENPKATFFSGSAIRAQDLNNNATQSLYSVQEWQDQTVPKYNAVMPDDLDLGTYQIKNLGEPTLAQDAATKNYVDTTTVASAGDSMTGNLAMGSNRVTGLGEPSASQDAATKNYVDTTTVASAGDNMTGNLAMGTNKVTGLGEPTASQDAATKNYVDTTTWNVTSETLDSTEAWVSSNSVIATTAATTNETDTRYDTLVQTATPAGSSWRTGKTWLQNDVNNTLSMWDGSTWKGVSSGGTFTTQPTVVYVDNVNGSDTNDGHRIINPMRTIKAAVASAQAGWIIKVAPGVYTESLPIDITVANLSIVGDSTRSCFVNPTVATETQIMFRCNSGTYIDGFTFAGLKATGARGGNAIDNDATYGLPTNQGWVAGFYPGATIRKSPWIQNCTNFADSGINNAAFDPNNYTGTGGDVTSGPTGGGIIVDGSLPSISSPLRSFVINEFTQVCLDGPGLLVCNNGYAQAVSFFGLFCHYHAKALSGGQINMEVGTTDFGRYGLIADGKSNAAIFTATANGAASASATTFAINAPSAGGTWFGDANRPAINMLVQIGADIYPILSATANGAGWNVVISRPNPSNRVQNLGLINAHANGAAVSFFLRSMVSTASHTMEYAGSGCDYNALPENGGVPQETNESISRNNGKVWLTSTDQSGKFKVGDTFAVDQQTGFVTIDPNSYSTNLVSDLTPELGGDLDVLTKNIYSSLGNVYVNDTLEVNSGSAATPAITFNGDTNTGLFRVGADQLAVTTNGTERIRFDSTGQVELVSLGTAAAPAFTWTTDADTGLYSSAANTLDVTTGGTAKVRFDDTAAPLKEIFSSVYYPVVTQVDIGTDPNQVPLNGYLGTMAFQDAAGVSIDQLSTSADATIFGVRVGRGSGSISTNVAVGNGVLNANTTGSNNTASGHQAFFNNTTGANNTATGFQSLIFNTTGDYNTATGGQALFNNTTGANNTGSGQNALRSNTTGSSNTANGWQALYFNTGSNNTCVGARAGEALTTGSNNTIIGSVQGTAGLSDTVIIGAGSSERLRIDSSGTFAPSGKLSLNGGNGTIGGTKRLIDMGIDGSLEWGIVIKMANTFGITILRNYNSSGVFVGGIEANTTSTSFSTSSDYRLKENVVELTGAIDRVNDLRVCRFNFIADPDKTVDGFLAHEAQAIVPECVTGTKDEVDADGNPLYQGIDQSKLVPLLTAALQEAIAKIASLEARLTALEAN
jgi:hypothetical protein